MSLYREFLARNMKYVVCGEVRRIDGVYSKQGAIVFRSCKIMLSCASSPKDSQQIRHIWISCHFSPWLPRILCRAWHYLPKHDVETNSFIFGRCNINVNANP